MANAGEAERTINEDAIAGAEGRLDRLEALADKLEVQIEEIDRIIAARGIRGTRQTDA